MNDTQQLDIQVNIEDDVLNAYLGDEDLQSDFTMGIIAKEYENLIAKTEQEMAELMIEENIGKFIRYEGEDGLYVNGAYYQVVLDDEADYTQYYTYKNDIDSVYFIQDSANVFSLYMLPIEVENGVSATTQTDNDGNVEVIING